MTSPDTDAPVIDVSNVSKRFGDFTALDHITLSLRPHAIYGLLGRNGAGKTTLMKILMAQDFATAGTVRLFGEQPYENAHVLSQACFVREGQKYPDSFKVKHALKAASWFFGNWSEPFSERLVEDFDLPLNRPIKKLSRGQLSAVGVVIGLASRAPLTIFDEPYLGLDAVARQVFYDRLLADYAEHPRTILLSTHLIDEVSNLLEHVVLIDRGRIILDADADELRASAITLAGPTDKVRGFAADREVLHEGIIGGLSTITLTNDPSTDLRAAATAAGLEVTPVSLQQLVVQLSQAAETDTRIPEEAAHV